jgi:MscS family membrane protein
MSGRGFDASLVRLLSGILAVMASVGVAAYGLERLGVDIVPLLAGHGCRWSGGGTCDPPDP